MTPITQRAITLPALCGVCAGILSWGGCASTARDRLVVTVTEEPAVPELTDALEILKRVDAATRAVHGVRYDATLFGTGALADRVPSMTGQVAFAGWDGSAPDKFYCHARGKRAGSDEPIEVTAGGNGDLFFVVDHPNRTAYEDIDPAVLGRTGGTARALMMIEFVHDTPFSDEINGDTQELRGSKMIGDEDCYEVRVVYAGGRGEAIWHFSKRDFLPRGRLDIVRDPSGEQVGAQQRFVTSLVVDPDLEESLFKLQLPEGFARSDDFAP